MQSTNGIGLLLRLGSNLVQSFFSTFFWIYDDSCLVCHLEPSWRLFLRADFGIHQSQSLRQHTSSILTGAPPILIVRRQRSSLCLQTVLLATSASNDGNQSTNSLVLCRFTVPIPNLQCVHLKRKRGNRSSLLDEPSKKTDDGSSGSVHCQWTPAEVSFGGKDHEMDMTLSDIACGESHTLLSVSNYF